MVPPDLPHRQSANDANIVRPVAGDAHRLCNNSTGRGTVIVWGDGSSDLILMIDAATTKPPAFDVVEVPRPIAPHGASPRNRLGPQRSR
jgi:hypothetical protein